MEPGTRDLPQQARCSVGHCSKKGGYRGIFESSHDGKRTRGYGKRWQGYGQLQKQLQLITGSVGYWQWPVG